MADLKRLLLVLCYCIVVDWSEGRALSRPRRASLCYDGECFTNDPPYNNTDGLLPQRPDFIQTTFRLYTGNSTNHPQILEPGNMDLLSQSGFDSQLPTRFVIHGFLQHARVRWVLNMSSELLNRQPSNVISVDWGHGSGFPYSQASANTRVVGYEVARLINFLKDNAGLSLNRVHLIGHSLGAHVAGYAGTRAQGIRRITGLDPAEPDFQGTDPVVRLDPTDAEFVDVIHTDGSEFDYVSGFGMLTPVGHIDFYPNGGKNQPGCPRENVENFVSKAYYQGLEDAEDILSCSHSRSIYLFIESIRSSCQFQAFRCQSLAALDTNRDDCMRCAPHGCPVMGFNADRTPQLTGSFYLRTRGGPPFCGYSQHIDVQFGLHMDSAAGSVGVSLVTDDQSSDYIDIHSGTRPFSGGQHADTLWIDRHRLDDIRRVIVSFRQSSTRNWFSSFHSSPKRVSIAMVTVTSARTGRRVFFCGDDQMIGNDLTVTLTRSSTDPQDCLSLTHGNTIFNNIF